MSGEWEFRTLRAGPPSRGHPPCRRRAAASSRRWPSGSGSRCHGEPDATANRLATLAMETRNEDSRFDILILQWVEDQGHPPEVLGYTPDGSPLICLRAGGDKEPAIFVSVGAAMGLLESLDPPRHRRGVQLLDERAPGEVRGRRRLPRAPSAAGASSSPRATRGKERRPARGQIP